MTYYAGGICTKTIIETNGKTVESETIHHKKGIISSNESSLPHLSNEDVKVFEEKGISTRLICKYPSKLHHDSSRIQREQIQCKANLSNDCKFGDENFPKIRQNMERKCTGCECCKEKNLIERKMTNMINQLEESSKESFILHQRVKKSTDDKEELKNKMICLSRELEAANDKNSDLLKCQTRLSKEKEELQIRINCLSKELTTKKAESDVISLKTRYSECFCGSEVQTQRPKSFQETYLQKLEKQLKDYEFKVQNLNKENQQLRISVEILTEEHIQWKSKFYSVEKKLKDAKVHWHGFKGLGDSLENILFTDIDDKPSELQKENEYLRNGIGQMERRLQLFMNDLSKLSSLSQQGQTKRETGEYTKDYDSEKERQRHIVIAPHTINITSPSYVCFPGTPDASFPLSSVDRDINEKCEIEETLEKECDAKMKSGSNVSFCLFE